ncbi:alpha-(1,3)-fucosyltransferase C-like [Littorina saxatilis]|uniref:Fucosyltransferase n=1 Tax=Littorina saxatilis TaxID=31220 RepID=A0AAN9AXQ2_9CAEN
MRLSSRTWVLITGSAGLLLVYMLLLRDGGLNLTSRPHSLAFQQQRGPAGQLQNNKNLPFLGPPNLALEQQGMSADQVQTSDNWPIFSKNMFPGPIPKSPFKPNFTITWDFDTAAFLERPDVKGQPPKLMTWVVKARYMPPLPEPVRLRVCPEMPCRMTTNKQYQKDSAALMWAGQIMREPAPPPRSHPDQVYVFHNHEPQAEWIHSPSFRKPAWKSAFNWTMHYRFDSDIVDLYGKLVKRNPPVKNYTAILAKKTKFAAWMVSHCDTHGRREKYIKLLRDFIPVDAYGGCAKNKCPRSSDDSCYKMINADYKFYFAFENAFCKDYITEKFFRYLEADTVVVARGSNEYKNHAPKGIFVNTADFKSAKDLAEHLLHLDIHPEEYIKILKAKDEYQPLYEDWPIRNNMGDIYYMHYHYESVSYCEMCKRLWDLDTYGKTVPDIAEWFDRENCYPPKDIR